MLPRRWWKYEIVNVHNIKNYVKSHGWDEKIFGWLSTGTRTGVFPMEIPRKKILQSASQINPNETC
jgi:hypothetical protein